MNAIFLAFPNCAIWQVASLQHALVEAQWTMRTLTLDGQPVQTDGGLTIAADGALKSVFPRDVQLLLLAGGALTDEVIDDPGLHRFLRQFDGGRGWIAAIGKAWLALSAAGLIGGRHVAVNSAAQLQFGNRLQHALVDDVPVRVDGNIVTAHSDAVDLFAATVMGCSSPRNISE